MHIQELNDIALECYTTAANHGFHDKPNPLPQSLMLIVSEAAEALEAYRDDEIDDDLLAKGKPPKPVGVLSELADIIIRTLDTAYELQGEHPGIRSIGDVIADKMHYNRSRPVGHGRVRL